MAGVVVRITRLLADIAGTARTTTVEATTAAEAVAALCAQVPALRVHVFDDDGNVRRHVNIFVRGEVAKGEGSLDVPVADGDEIAVIQAVSGGAVASTTASSDRAELAITTWAGDETPIVALHPGVGDSRIWQWCAPVWAEAGHRVVAYDRRGFGETRYEAEPHAHIDDLLAVTAATDARPAVIVGNSLGGGLAIDLALAHPDQVSALVLIAPSPSGYSYDSWPLATAEAELDDLIKSADEAGDIDLVNRLEVRYWLDGVEQPEGRVDGPARELMTEMNGRALRAKPTGDATQPPPAWPRLDQITVPTMVVAGEHDLPGVVQQCAQLAAALPNTRLETVADSAHCPSLDQPERLNEIVLEFLGAG